MESTVKIWDLTFLQKMTNYFKIETKQCATYNTYTVKPMDSLYH